VRSVQDRLVRARSTASGLESPGLRRIMTGQLEAMQQRLNGGENPRTIDAELTELLKQFAPR